MKIKKIVIDYFYKAEKHYKKSIRKFNYEKKKILRSVFFNNPLST